MSQIDPIIGLGAVLGDELFDTAPAVIVIDEQERRRIATGDMIQIDASGAITVARLTGVAPDADTR